jgi:serpin B
MEQLKRDTRLLALNAFYFHKLWEKPFEQTAPGPFRLETGEIVSVPIMRQRGDFGHARRDKTDVIELKYQSPDYSFFLLVPRSQSLAELANSLTADELFNGPASYPSGGSS